MKLNRYNWSADLAFIRFIKERYGELANHTIFSKEDIFDYIREYNPKNLYCFDEADNAEIHKISQNKLCISLPTLLSKLMVKPCEIKDRLSTILKSNPELIYDDHACTCIYRPTQIRVVNIDEEDYDNCVLEIETEYDKVSYSFDQIDIPLSSINPEAVKNYLIAFFFEIICKK